MTTQHEALRTADRCGICGDHLQPVSMTPTMTTAVDSRSNVLFFLCLDFARCVIVWRHSRG